MTNLVLRLHHSMFCYIATQMVKHSKSNYMCLKVEHALTCTLSPGLTLSTKSSSKITSTDLGS